MTQHVFSMIKRYRDLGGNLAFLSANNFYARVAVSGSRMRCVGRFRDLGRPEAAIVGVQYVDWWQRRYPSRPFVVRSVAAARVAVPGHRPAQGSTTSAGDTASRSTHARVPLREARG